MSFRKILLGLAVFMLLALSALIVGVLVPVGNAAAHTGLRPDPPPYGVRGPHPVGTRDQVIDGEAPLDITLKSPCR